jgi:undecaprenyl-diphosphatase
LQSFDDILFPLLNRGAANPFLDWLMPRITNLHKETWFILIALVTCLILAWRGNRRMRVAILCAVLAVGLSDVLAARVVKKLVVRERPCQAASMVTTVRVVPGEHCPGSKSFPSNHASNMMALAIVGWWFSRKKDRESRTQDQPPNASTPQDLLPWLWFLLPLVIGYSRIYLGYHYPPSTSVG